MRPLVVVYFTNVVTRGGAEEHILTLLRGLDRSRFRPHLVCTPELASRVRVDVPADVPIVALTLRRPHQLAAAFRLARVLRTLRTDILHSHLFYSSVFASPVGYLAGVPVIIETPHVRERWRQGWLKSHYFVDRLVGRLIDGYIAVSAANAQYLTAQKGLPSSKVVVIHNGCDLARFQTPTRAAEALRASLGFAPDDPVVLLLGRLEPQKGHRVLLEAFPAVRTRFCSARLVCVGEGALREELEAQAGRLGLNGSVRFVGYQTNVADWLALADLTVLPSFYEGLPLAAIESLAAGRPVVATRVDGTPEVVVEGRTGLTVPPGHPRALADAICRLLAEPSLRDRIGRAGRQWVEKYFDQDAQIEQTQKLYAQAWSANLGLPVSQPHAPRAADRHLQAREPGSAACEVESA